MSTSTKKLTWLITGSSSGFGLSLVRHVQGKGHNVIATSRNPSKTPELVAEIESKGGKWIGLDVTDLKSGKIIDDLEASGQHIDVLVNNAGFSTFAPVETSTEDEVRAQMETMYFGPLRLIRAVVPHMRKRRSGTIVNFSSGASLLGSDSMGPYAGAKAGLDGVTRVLAKEIAPFNVRTLTVVLGTFNTSLGDKASFGETPLPEDYKGSTAETIMQYISSGKFMANGDKDKAMRVVFEVATGRGVGAGHESEQLLPLGADMIDRFSGARDRLARSLEVFGEVAESVKLE